MMCHSRRQCKEDQSRTKALLIQAGQVRISTGAATLEHLAQQFWHRILAMADLDDDQQLSLDEFQGLMKVCSAAPHCGCVRALVYTTCIY